MNPRNDPDARFDAQLRDALRRMPHGTPPLDFARTVAVAARVRGHRGDRWWLLSAALVFVPAVLFAIAHDRGAWAGTFAPLLRMAGGAEGSLEWVAAAAACVALTWALSRLRPATG